MFTLFGDRVRRRKSTPVKKASGRNLPPGMIEIEGIARHPVAATRKRLTPNQLAIQKLNMGLLLFEAPDSLRRRFSNEFIGSDQLRYMNMTTLAAALMFLNDLPENSELTSDYFTDERLRPILVKLMPLEINKTTGKNAEKKNEDTASLKRKHRESLLRYIRYVLLYRQMRKQQFEQGVLPPNEELAPEDLIEDLEENISDDTNEERYIDFSVDQL